MTIPFSSHLTRVNPPLDKESNDDVPLVSLTRCCKSRHSETDIRRVICLLACVRDATRI